MAKKNLKQSAVGIVDQLVSLSESEVNVIVSKRTRASGRGGKSTSIVKTVICAAPSDIDAANAVCKRINEVFPQDENTTCAVEKLALFPDADAFETLVGASQERDTRLDAGKGLASLPASAQAMLTDEQKAVIAEYEATTEEAKASSVDETENVEAVAA